MSSSPVVKLEAQAQPPIASPTSPELPIDLTVLPQPTVKTPSPWNALRWMPRPPSPPPPENDILAPIPEEVLNGNHMAGAMNAPWADGLEGFDVHPLWRPDAFRTALYSSLLPVPHLDHHEFNYPSEMYDRMKPALRLTTLFLKMVTPYLARIRYAPVKDVVTPDGRTVRRLDEAGWRETPAKMRSFEQDLMRMCKSYRITAVTDAQQHVSATCEHANVSAISNILQNWLHKSPLKVVFAHTALNVTWLDFLSSSNWDAMDEAKKYNRLLGLALTLIHELAHAIWFHRMASVVEYDRRPPHYLTFDLTEPNYGSMEWAESGYFIEQMLVGGLHEFYQYDDDHLKDDVLFTQIDNDGRAVSFQTMHKSYAQVFFNGPTWTDWDQYAPPYFPGIIPGRVQYTFPQPQQTMLTRHDH